MFLFANRRAAGKQLAARLMQYQQQDDVLVLGLPRGGVPVAYEISQALQVPLDIFIVRKLGVPGQEELAMGAIASGGVEVLNHDVIAAANVTEDQLALVKQQELAELSRREQRYRGERPFPSIKDHTIILVDDGVATGATMRAAILALKHLHPTKLILAIPVAPADTCDELARMVDSLIVLETPEPFYGIGMWYGDFSQTTDEEVLALVMTCYTSPD